MLGLPINSWLRFYICGFLAGVLLCSVRFGPMIALGTVAMILAICGLVFVATYTRYYSPRQWRQWMVALRRTARTVRRLAPYRLHYVMHHPHVSVV